MNNKNYYEELMKKHDSWSDLVKDLIVERLKEYKGQKFYICDLSYELFEQENKSGSFTYSTYWSKEFIIKYWDEFRNLYDNYLENYGTFDDSLNNWLDKPEVFVVLMLLQQAEQLFTWGNNKFIEDNWNNEVELNNKNIKKIIESLES